MIVIYAEKSFAQLRITGIRENLNLAKIQSLIFDNLQVPAVAQKLWLVEENGLVEMQPQSEPTFRNKDLTIVLSNTMVKSESDLKSLTSLDENLLEDFRPVKVIDLDKPDNREFMYSHINLVPSVLTKEISENFNFRSLFSSKNSLSSTFPGMDLFQLQTFEQLFFNNFSKVKTSYKRFKGKSKDCQAQLKSLEDMADILAELNRVFSTGKKTSSRSGLANPIQELKVQF